MGTASQREKSEEDPAQVLEERNVLREQLAELADREAQLSHDFLLLRDAVEQATDGIVMSGEDRLVSYFNGAAEKMFGYTRDEVLGSPWAALIPESHRERTEAGVTRFLASEQDTELSKVIPLEGLHKNGTAFPIELGVSTFRIEGQVVFTGVVRDMTERHHADAQLRESEERYRAIFEGAIEMIHIIDEQYRIVDVNETEVRRLGYTRAEIIGKPLREIIHPDSLGDDFEAVVARAQSGETVESFEATLLAKDGTRIPIVANIVPIMVEGKFAGAQGILRDISDRKRAEEALQVRTAELLHSDRLVAVGQLAGGVAHEINNPAAFVTSNLTVLQKHIDKLEGVLNEIRERGRKRSLDDRWVDDLLTEGEVPFLLHDTKAILQDNLEGMQRISGITKDLRSFARIEGDEIELVDLNEIVRSVSNMVSNEIRHRAKLVENLGKVPLIAADRAKLAQVVMNLMMNAAQAIEDGEASKNQITVETSRGEGTVILTVTDTGRGIAEQDQERVFEPFFTTKARTVGTGLGMPIAMEIVRRHGGDIRFSSTVGEGTCFEVTLQERTPIPASPSLSDSHAPLPVGPRLRARVLLIDDEAMLRSAMSRILEPHHEIVVADGGLEALAELERDNGFDVILCDLMMPDLDGAQLYSALRETMPFLLHRIVFISGGAFTPAALNFIGSVHNFVLEKPVSRALLLSVIDKIATKSLGAEG